MIMGTPWLAQCNWTLFPSCLGTVNSLGAKSAHRAITGVVVAQHVAQILGKHLQLKRLCQKKLRYWKDALHAESSNNVPVRIGSRLILAT